MYCTHYIPSVLICICTINKDYYYIIYIHIFGQQKRCNRCTLSADVRCSFDPLREINCNCMHILFRALYFINIYYLYIIHNIINTS